MTHYKLTYFDVHGGRAESIRLAFCLGGIPFEDERWSFAEFGQKRASLRFNAVPVLTIDGAEVTQSNALNRYVGRLAGLYPEDLLQAGRGRRGAGHVGQVREQPRRQVERRLAQYPRDTPRRDRMQHRRPQRRRRRGPIAAPGLCR